MALKSKTTGIYHNAAENNSSSEFTEKVTRIMMIVTEIISIISDKQTFLFDLSLVTNFRITPPQIRQYNESQDKYKLSNEKKYNPLQDHKV